MSLEKAVEAIIKEAQERGDFDNLKGKGKPIDLTAYFETPEDVRTTYEEKDRNRIKKMIREKQLQFNVMLERQKRQQSKSSRK